MTTALDGLRVLDLSMGIAGPMATMVLGDNGADVIKIEPPSGDPFSHLLGYRAWQRGKRNAVYDLNNPSDHARFMDLVKTADVLVESFAPGTTAALGIDYEALQSINPHLIYCSITAYGRDNELSDRPGYDALVAARIGFHYEQRGHLGGAYHGTDLEIPYADFEFDPNGVVGPRHHDRDGPLFPATFWPSVGAAYAAMTAINAALFVRETSGRGQFVETSLLQGALTAGTLAYSRADRPDAPHFATWINDCRSPKGNFECADGRWILNWVPNPSFALGASEGEELNPTPDMSAREDPNRIMPAIEDMMVLNHYYPLMAAAFKRFSAAEWVDAGAVAGQCIQPVNSPEEGLSDPHFVEDGCVADIPDPEFGATRQVGTLFNLEKLTNTVRSGIAKHGEHTAEVMAETGDFADRSPEAAPLPKHPLAGITVIDLGLAIAGPFGAQVLSDLGADVIKVNATYDWYWHSNAIAMSANRGKRSIAINMRDPAGIEIIQKLAARADVLIHNMRHKAVAGKGLDYDTLKRANPRLIYCHTRGFEKGPREPLPGNDQTGSALAGVQWEDGACANGGRPYWSQTTMGDTGNGYLAAIAILQALRHRERTGEGQFVDTSIVNAHFFNGSHVIAKNDGSGFERPTLDGDALGYGACYRLYKTADGYLCIVVANDDHWRALLETLGQSSLLEDPAFSDGAARARNSAKLVELFAASFATETTATWFARLDAAGVPCEIADQQFSANMWRDGSFLREREWLVNLPHPVVGRIGHVGVPYSLSATPAIVQGRPLIVGEATRDILTELGYSETEQAGLFETQTVADESCYGYPLSR